MSNNGRKPTVRELAEQHGIDLSKMQDQQEHIDVTTGKRAIDGYTPFIIAGKDMTEHFAETVAYLRDLAARHRKRDNGEAGSPSVVWDNICDDFELVLDHNQQLKAEIERLRTENALLANDAHGEAM